MNLRWLLGNFTDPEFDLSPSEQREVTRLAHRKHLAGRTLTLWTLALSVGGWGAMAFGAQPLAGVLAGVGVRQPLMWSIGMLCVAVCVAAAWAYRFIYRRPVRLAMRDLGHDICVECGYRLTGLADDMSRCPECGALRLPRPIVNESA